jgi:hypothetical protein
MKTNRIKTTIVANGFRAGATVGTVIAFIGALGAPVKWS